MNKQEALKILSLKEGDNPSAVLIWKQYHKLTSFLQLYGSKSEERFYQLRTAFCYLTSLNPERTSRMIRYDELSDMLIEGLSEEEKNRSLDDYLVTRFKIKSADKLKTALHHAVSSGDVLYLKNNIFSKFKSN